MRNALLLSCFTLLVMTSCKPAPAPEMPPAQLAYFTAGSVLLIRGSGNLASEINSNDLSPLKSLDIKIICVDLTRCKDCDYHSFSNYLAGYTSCQAIFFCVDNGTSQNGFYHCVYSEKGYHSEENYPLDELIFRSNSDRIQKIDFLPKAPPETKTAAEAP